MCRDMLVLVLPNSSSHVLPKSALQGELGLDRVAEFLLGSPCGSISCAFDRNDLRRAWTFAHGCGWQQQTGGSGYRGHEDVSQVLL